MKWIGMTISANQKKGNLIEYLTREYLQIYTENSSVVNTCSKISYYR